MCLCSQAVKSEERKIYEGLVRRADSLPYTMPTSPNSIQVPLRPARAPTYIYNYSARKCTRQQQQQKGG